MHKVQGIILEYNSKENHGKIQLIDNRIIEFQTTICNNMEIWLKEDIIAEFENEELISIKPDKEKQKEYFDLPFKPVKYIEKQKLFAKSVFTEEYLKLLEQSVWGEISKIE